MGTLSKEKICTSLGNELQKHFNEIKGIADPISRQKDMIQSKITSVSSEDLADPEDVESKMDQAANDTDISETKDEVEGILDCFGQNNLDSGNLGLDKADSVDAISGSTNSLLSDIISVDEQELMDMINKLEKSIPTDKIDRAMGLAKCLQNCPQGTPITDLELETELNNNMITTSGEIDLDGFENGSDISNRVSRLKDKKKETENKILDKVKGLF